MESIEILTINHVVLSNVTINVTKNSILNVYSNNNWICGIAIWDIKTFTSTDKMIEVKVKKLISELE